MIERSNPLLEPIERGNPLLETTHDVIGVLDERTTSLSQEIDVNSVREEPSSLERTERLVTGPVPGKPVHETSVIQTRSSEDRKGFNVETGT